MNEIYISVSITTYSNGSISCRMAQSVNDGPLEITELEEQHAHKLIWELVKAGGRRSYHANYLNHSIIYQDAYIFLPN